MSINSLLFTSRDALMSHQMAIDVTGGNIANVNTPGYARQRTDLRSVGNVNVNGAGAQIGVTVSGVVRIYDRYVESRIIEQQQNSGYGDTMLQVLENMEVLLDETQGGGISDQLNRFWASWENLSQNPGGIVERSALVSTAENLTGSLTAYRTDLESINTDLNRNITDVVSQINRKVDEILDLNLKIMETADGEGGNNDLLDKRTQALKDLGALADIQYLENADGSLNVYLSNGDALLQGILGERLSVRVNSGKRCDIFFSRAPQDAVNGAITKGKLGALIELQGTIVPEYVAYIENFTGTLANRVDELHSSGFDAYKNTGINFFEIPNPDNMAGTIRVNPAIAADVNRIAASSSVTNNGEIAGRIASVQNELLMNNQTSTLNSFLATVVGRIGQQVSAARANIDHQTLIMNQLGNQRESISGVSIDEEMIRLIKFQMGYNAAGKLCTVVDEMLDTLMGLVK